MLRSYRHILFALVGFLTLAAQHPNPEAESDQAKAQGSISNRLGDIATTYHQESEGAHSAKPETDYCGPAQYQSKTDLCAQWKAADAAADAAWWAAVGAWVSGLSGILVLGALFLAFQSNRIARDTAKRQLRAYVSHKEYVMKHHRQADGAFVSHDITAIWLNGGETPALNTHCVINFVFQITPLAGDFSFPEPANVETFGSLALGPGQQCNVLSPTISHQQFLGLSEESHRLFVWSRADYVDAFGVARRSEVACEVKIVALDDAFRIVFNSIGKHNGMDDTCMYPPGKD